MDCDTSCKDNNSKGRRDRDCMHVYERVEVTVDNAIGLSLSNWSICLVRIRDLVRRLNRKLWLSLTVHSKPRVLVSNWAFHNRSSVASFHEIIYSITRIIHVRKCCIKL